jgi:6-phosphogluconate dehydrogenase
LELVSAKDFGGLGCVTNVGVGPAGHFVKMVHNGIEYAMMQGIAEVYDILRKLSLDNLEIKEYFDYINTEDNKGFLLDITCQILATKDNLSDGFLLEKIDSRAGAKGTGKWTVETALDLGVAVPSIFAGLNSRIMSESNWEQSQFLKDKAKEIDDTFQVANFNKLEDKEILQNILHQVVEAVFFCSYKQGIDLINKANTEYSFGIDILEVLRIIRSKMLKTLINVIDQPDFKQNKFTNSMYNILNFCQFCNLRIPLPVIDATKDYVLSLSSDSLPQNLIQAQRDHFGAHTYKRTDREGVFTDGWN